MIHRLATFCSHCKGLNVTLRDAAQVPRFGVQRPIETAHITEAQGTLSPPSTARHMETLGIWRTLVSQMKC